MNSDVVAVVVGIDVGGTKTNVTVLDEAGRFLVEGMLDQPSRVIEGPAAALAAMREAVDRGLASAGVSMHAVRAIGLDTPGPASASGVISSRGSTNFADPVWWGFDVRGAAEAHFHLPVIYNNDGNTAALYAHQQYFGPDAAHRSSVSAIVGTGLGGGIIEGGRVVRGASGMAGELGHVHIPMSGLLADDQPQPRCNCGLEADAESVASLSGIINNLLPYWLTRYPDHPLAADPSIGHAAREVRGYAERGDEMALHIFRQQAVAIGHLFTIAANVIDPDVFFVGGGVVEARAAFRDQFLNQVRDATHLRSEQALATSFALVPDLDLAGARGAAIAAMQAVRPMGFVAEWSAGK